MHHAQDGLHGPLATKQRVELKQHNQAECRIETRVGTSPMASA